MAVLQNRLCHRVIADKHAPMKSAPNAAVNADSRGPAGDWRVLAVAVVLTLAAVGAYWNSFNVPFLMDDALSIGDNPSIRHFGRIGDPRILRANPQRF